MMPNTHFDAAQLHILMLPNYTLWKLGPCHIHNEHRPPSIHNWTGKKNRAVRKKKKKKKKLAIRTQC
jgi:hypothetical protein